MPSTNVGAAVRSIQAEVQAITKICTDTGEVPVDIRVVAEMVDVVGEISSTYGRRAPWRRNRA